MSGLHNSAAGTANWTFGGSAANLGPPLAGVARFTAPIHIARSSKDDCRGGSAAGAPW